MSDLEKRLTNQHQKKSLKKKAVKKVAGMADDFVLIIKPSDESTFQNL
jgi:hypothetical protein